MPKKGGSRPNSAAGQSQAETPLVSSRDLLGRGLRSANTDEQRDLPGPALVACNCPPDAWSAQGAAVHRKEQLKTNALSAKRK